MSNRLNRLTLRSQKVQKAIPTVRQMMKDGCHKLLIADVTGLSVDTVRKIGLEYPVYNRKPTQEELDKYENLLMFRKVKRKLVPQSVMYEQGDIIMKRKAGNVHITRDEFFDMIYEFMAARKKAIEEYINGDKQAFSRCSVFYFAKKYKLHVPRYVALLIKAGFAIDEIYVDRNRWIISKHLQFDYHVNHMSWKALERKHGIGAEYIKAFFTNNPAFFVARNYV